ncbi:hypothetical protein QQX98_007026 [Neonectria punicea]|uniref:Uncharacterized protein n=1 Tax=Neonectria punicea TaxID=979145 RepID=A0ABR1GZ28_9HYPO
MTQVIHCRLLTKKNLPQKTSELCLRRGAGIVEDVEEILQRRRDDFTQDLGHKIDEDDVELEGFLEDETREMTMRFEKSTLTLNLDGDDDDDDDN